MANLLNPFDIATEGLRRGHQWIARLGFLGVEIDVEPIPPAIGGGGSFGTVYEPEEYLVRVKVTIKGKTFTDERLMTAKGVASLEKVVVFFRYARALYDRTELMVKYIGNKIKDLISVKSYFKRDDK